jgi:SAM-dependent methyltransferase
VKADNTDKVFTTSRRVLARDFNEQWLKDRAREMCLETDRMHRKIWEFAAICQVFRDNYNKNAEKSIKCLGFGVGLEPLTSYFAAQNAVVIASDKPEMGPWNGQYARFKGDLFEKEIVDETRFRDNVSFLPLDMANIPEDLLDGSFDFTWSCGSFEHIGGLDASLDFFCNQMRALKPGGIAAHTTEYNFGSNTETINASDLVLFRKQDLERLDHMLKAQGDRLFPLDLCGGDLPEDQIVDVYPYTNPVHLALRINEQVSTSIILIAQRGK